MCVHGVGVHPPIPLVSLPPRRPRSRGRKERGRVADVPGGTSAYRRSRVGVSGPWRRSTGGSDPGTVVVRVPETDSKTVVQDPETGSRPGGRTLVFVVEGGTLKVHLE